MTFRFQSGRSAPLPEPTGSTAPRQSRRICNTSRTRAAESLGAKRQDRSEDQDPHKSHRKICAQHVSTATIGT